MDGQIVDIRCSQCSQRTILGQHLADKRTKENLAKLRRIIVDVVGEPPELDDDWDPLHGAVVLIDEMIGGE